MLRGVAYPIFLFFSVSLFWLVSNITNYEPSCIAVSAAIGLCFLPKIQLISSVPVLKYLKYLKSVPLVQNTSIVHCIMIHDRTLIITDTKAARKTPNSVRSSVTNNICKNVARERVDGGYSHVWASDRRRGSVSSSQGCRNPDPGPWNLITVVSFF
jgi:hypothetical protein